jgi:type II secretory pathway component GspD/PulD (secretin)/tetratricopeptide (TPR) repeat protein
MVFQATKWSWKRIAARVLLVPVLAGGSAAIAQQKTTTPIKTSSGPVMAASGDHKALLKEGRKALSEGRFNDAQDCARRAEASNASGKWGLFDDTPNALLKDVQAAVLKSQKAEAEQLVKQAKALLHKTAASDAEKASNLDSALQMARRADSLHGSYSAWDFTDRPDKLVKEIETARGKMKLPAPSVSVASKSGPEMIMNAGVVPAGGVAPKSAVVPASGVKSPTAAVKPPVTAGPASPVSTNANDAKKTAAIKLMAEGKVLAGNGDFAGAHAKLTAAVELKATFGADETSPDFALRELNARGATAIDGLLKDAQSKIAKKDFAKADAALNAANEIALALSLFPRPIEEAKTALRMASDGKFGGIPVNVLAPVAGVEKVIPLGPAPAGPVTPPAPPGIATIGLPPVVEPKTPVAPPMVKPEPVVNAVPTPPVTPAPMVKPEPVVNAVPTPPVTPAPMVKPEPVVNNVPVPGMLPIAQPGGLTGRDMLDKATLEFRKGDFEMATRLAQKAINLGGVQKEATGLLNQIDAEVFSARQRNAEKSFEAAASACKTRDYGHALSVLVIIDPNLLTAEMKAQREALIATCKTELEKSGTVLASGQQPTPAIPSVPGTATVGGAPKAADNLANQADSMRQITFQKLRTDGLKVQTDAQASFGKGETDVAIQMLMDYKSKVQASGLDSARVAMLNRPIDSRLDMFKVMKGQADATARLVRENRDAKELVASRGGAADEQRKSEVSKLVRQYQELVKKGDYATAERVALQAKQLEPDDPAITALAHMAKTTRRVKEQERLKDDKERMVYGGLTDAEKEGPLVTTEDPLAFNIERTMKSKGRGRGDDAYLRSRTPKEFEIELSLDKRVKLEFNQTPLSEVISTLHTTTGLPFSWDTAALEGEQISTAKPITETQLGEVSVRNLLGVVLDKAGLSFVIEYDTVRITTQKKAKGRLVTKVFSVTDLVTPIPNFAMPEYANIDKILSRTGRPPSGIYPGSSGLLPANGLSGGQVASSPLNGAQMGTGSPVGISGGNYPGAGSGTLQNNPLAQSSSVASDKGTKHEQLMKLVTGMVRPFSWDSQGGPGRIEYFDLGGALVVNQTADVIREVQDLLEALRRLQDLAVAVEIRIISLSETWFERMGVDFSMNVKTHTASFEPALTSQQFRPEPYVNDINSKGVVLGMQPSGTFTPDLDVPIRATSFNRAIPGFGGYPNTPGANGGVSLGLAFLNDIQVYMFMEAAQGDRRVNVMQAPKLTLFNGQTATMLIGEQQFFVTDVQVYSVNGQVVFVPTIQNLPGPGDFNLGGLINITVQAVVSADRRFVRINLPITLAAQTGATVPLFPVTTFITPVFEGGSQGVPIPFTQFLQQPAFTTLNIQTTVVCPDGGTVLLGGLKKLSEGRNEFGPPFLSKIPYLNRLFKNVGIGRETQHIMIMVTPRIIINSEEEINQTEGGPLGTGGPNK